MDAVEVTEGDLLEELAGYYERRKECVQPEDVTARKLAARVGVTLQAAKNRLDYLVRTGKLVAVKDVYDPEIKRYVTVFRRP